MNGGGYRDVDMEFKPVSGPASYGNKADGPVQYVLVANGDGVLGYLWFSDQADAAGWIARRSAGDIAVNAGGFWIVGLRPSKAEGLPPSQAVARMSTEDGGPVAGRIVHGSEGTVQGVDVLRQLAAN